jgi:hypothetical protein
VGSPELRASQDIKDISPATTRNWIWSRTWRYITKTSRKEHSSSCWHLNFSEKLWAVDLAGPYHEQLLIYRTVN